MKRYDKSLIEVWEWKEKVYREVKDMSPSEYVNKIKNDAEKILSNSHIKLPTVAISKRRQKVA